MIFYIDLLLGNLLHQDELFYKECVFQKNCQLPHNLTHLLYREYQSIGHDQFL